MKNVAMLSTVLVCLAPSASFADQTRSFHFDYKYQYLSPTGGTLSSSFHSNTVYSASLAYPAGATNTLAGLWEYQAEAIPPGMSEIHLQFIFGVGSRTFSGFVFKGTSILTIMVPSSIPVGTKLLLSTFAYSNNQQVFGSTLSGTVNRSSEVVFTLSNLTFPPSGPIGFTLGQ